MNKKYALILIAGIVAGGILVVSWGSAGGGVLRQLGNVVGIYASIEPNQYNTLAQQLNERSQQLDEREAELAAERNRVEQIVNEKDRKATTYITAIGLLLLVLVVFNFYLDWRRKK